MLSVFSPSILVSEASRIYRTPKPIQTWRDLLRRGFDETEALHGISFRIEPGEKVGYLGPNGSGKSTTVKLLSGILPPTTGIVEVNGIQPAQNRIENAKQIGIAFGQRSQLWWDTPVISSYELLKRIYGIPDATYESMLSIVVDQLQLEPLLAKPVRHLSLGQRMRSEIASILLHRPAVVYLDEPTIGLDIETKMQLRSLLQYMNKEFNTTIFMTSHDIAEVERLCNRIILVNHGTIIFDGTQDALRSRYHPIRQIGIQYTSSSTNNIDMIHPALIVEKIENDWTWINFNPQVIAAAEAIRLLTAHLDIQDIMLRHVDLENVLLAAYDSSLME